MNKLCCLILLTSVLTSCVKKKETIITGKITDKQTGEPIQGVYISLSKSYDNGTHQYKDMGTAVTNSNGVYVFNFKESTDLYYYSLGNFHSPNIYCERLDSYDSTYVYPNEIMNNKVITRDFKFDKCGHIQLILKYIYPSSNPNVIKEVNLDYPCEESWNFFKLYFSLWETDTISRNVKVIGNTYAKYSYIIRKLHSGSPVTYTDSLFVPVNANVIDTIYY